MLNNLLAIVMAWSIGSSTLQQEPTPEPIQEVTQIQEVVVPEEPQINQEELHCLARNIYFEARGEGRTGMRAVGHVTMNRVNHRGFRDTICGVVYQRRQFSWTSNNYRVREDQSWERSLDIAEAIYLDKDSDVTNGATHFHNASVWPSWANRFTRTAVIGNHYFYRA